MSNTALQVIPSNIELPAHLRDPNIAAKIAADNAAAAGGVRAGGFPSISIKANKFSIKDGDEVQTLMLPPAAPGQPALPMMCLEVVVVDANPALTHTFFGELKNGQWVPADYVEGENKEPDCRSANGVTPDSDAPSPQSASCANCPQYAWGSKISKLSGKPVRACGDSKQLAVVPAGDLAYKMLGLQIKAGSLKNWGIYIQALNGRGYGVSTLVTNITFDQTQNGVLQFTFNRFLSAEEYAQAERRKAGDDVKLIVAQSRSLGAAPHPALPAPPTNLGLPAPGTTAPAYTAPVAPSAPPAAPPPPPAPPAPPPPATGFNAVPPAPAAPAQSPSIAAAGAAFAAGATPPATAPAAPPAVEPPKRTRRPRQPAPPAPPTGDLSHIPADIMTTINAVGRDSAAGQALIAAYPAPATPAAPAAPAQPAAPAPAPAAPAFVAPSAAPAPQVGFGAAPAAPAPTAPAQQPTAATVAAGASLAEKLRAKLGLPAA